MRSLVSVVGRVSTPETAVVPALDRGFLFGDSVYEVLWWHRGALVQAPEHFARLRESGRRIHMDVPDDDATWVARVDGLLAEAGATDDDDAYVRLIVTRGAGPLGLAIGPGLVPTWVLVVADAHRPTMEQRRAGLRARVADRLRVSSRALDPAAKTGNYMNNLLALEEARREGADDAILLNEAGDVTEATTSNVYVVSGGTVATPPLEAGILRGTTHTRVLALCARHGRPVVERRISAGELRRADELFVSSSVRGVLPVVALDGVPVGTGAVGPETARVIGWFEAAADADALAAREARRPNAPKGAVAGPR